MKITIYGWSTNQPLTSTDRRMQRQAVAAVWPLPCESSLQRFPSPGQSLWTAADL
jgi:hypothetical protein